MVTQRVDIKEVAHINVGFTEHVVFSLLPVRAIPVSLIDLFQENNSH